MRHDRHPAEAAGDGEHRPADTDPDLFTANAASQIGNMMTEANPPVLLVVDAHPEELATTATALARRFSADYRIATADSGAAGLDALRRLTDHGEQVTLVAVDQHLPDLDGVAFLERTAALHRGIARVLLTRWTSTTPASRSPSCPPCNPPSRSGRSTSSWSRAGS